MIDKRALTKKLLKELKLETHGKSIRKHRRLWWMNPRNMDNSQGYRLTDAGYLMMTEKLEAKSYEINYPLDIELNSRLILNMDKYLDGPYFLKTKSIVVFKEKMAVEIILYEGDIEKYTRAKIMSQKYNTATT
jgi:superfamily I DNA and/or RNA helicase